MTLCIGAVPAVVESAVAPMLARCVEDDGAMRFDIQVHLSGDLLRSLQSGALDLAMRPFLRRCPPT